jgi:hypothetical protein
MIGCCCTDEPCCAQRLFREDGKNLPELTLTLESRQRWQAFSIPGCSPLTVPPTTTINSQDITLTYANPIPSAFFPPTTNEGEPTYWPDFFFPQKGWYLSPSVTLWAISGDPVWTGSVTPITGRYFYHTCFLGIWLDSDTTIAADTPGIAPGPEWQNYINKRRVEWEGTLDVEYYYGHGAGSELLPKYSLHTNGLWAAPIVGAEIRGFILKDFGALTCRPLLAEIESMTQARHPGTSTPCDGGVTPTAGRNLSPIRLAETFNPPNTNNELNPLNTNMGSVSSTPPSSVLALESTHYVEEQFHMLFTISEP